jgi:type VI secretion system protein ImpA
MFPTPQKLMERDHEILLQPIQADAPAGESLRYDPIYDQINTARRGEDGNLPQGVWQRATQQPDWNLVEELCYTTLQTRSKDLQLAVWLTEAWLHLYGLCGVASGCQLILDLHENYLLTMFPAPTLAEGASPDRAELPLDIRDDAIEHRLNMLQWLNEKLSIEIKLLPLTAPFEHSDVLPVSLADVEAAQHRSHLSRKPGDVKPGPLDAGLARSLELTSEDHLAQTWTDLHQALDTVQQLGAALDRFYGEANSGLLRITDVLNEMIAAIAPGLPLSRQTAAPETEPAISLQASDTSPSQDTPSTIHTAGADVMHNTHLDLTRGIATREEAYALLEKISDFLARIEPHSPVPYLLKRAIAWGGMSLQELLPELLNDPSALKDVGHLLRLDPARNRSTN